ncbi:Beta-phosphoglucomutase [Alkalibacterium sp. AK22]|uniref:beta-phosphoglucomutase n=1 Tax=Alkalibacterium sp. AK22 TaxID=1229520 RepID=UPI000446A9A4|nr:beta-phosphoglucomutase [Alkalibacterium sp. AK22]EXJ23378.1 Beta-phosphoglucomutase [Alkalibacterium sp. AK22]
MIKGLIFDLDGVITDTAEYHYLAWKSLAEKIGIEIDREFNEQLKGISRMESLELILERGGKADAYTDAEKEELATQKNEEYKESIKEITPKDILPGISELLKEAKEQKLGLVLASASKNGPAIMERLEIMDLFDGIVDPASLKAGKPDPEIFVRGAEMLGLSTRECVGLEDAEAGIQAINGADMFSVGVGSEEAMREADYAVADTADLNLQTILEKAGS